VIAPVTGWIGYNTAYHSVLRTSLFTVVYSHTPPKLLLYAPGGDWTDAVDALLNDHDEFVAEVPEDIILANVQCVTLLEDARHFQWHPLT